MACLLAGRHYCNSIGELHRGKRETLKQNGASYLLASNLILIFLSPSTASCGELPSMPRTQVSSYSNPSFGISLIVSVKAPSDTMWVGTVNYLQGLWYENLQLLATVVATS